MKTLLSVLLGTCLIVGAGTSPCAAKKSEAQVRQEMRELLGMLCQESWAYWTKEEREQIGTLFDKASKRRYRDLSQKEKRL